MEERQASRHVRLRLFLCCVFFCFFFEVSRMFLLLLTSKVRKKKIHSVQQMDAGKHVPFMLLGAG